jgi:hypothetical protein
LFGSREQEVTGETRSDAGLWFPACFVIVISVILSTYDYRVK